MSDKIPVVSPMAAELGITQGYRGVAVLGGASPITLPIMPGSGMDEPMNYNIPYAISGKNIYQYVTVEGLQFPVFNLPLAINQGWFTAANLNTWLGLPTRTNDDIPVMGPTLSYWDGKTGTEGTNPKLSVLNLGASQGELVRCSMEIWGVEDTDLEAAPASTLITDTPASFQHTGYSVYTGIASWDLSIRTNLVVNPALPTAGHTSDAVHPVEHNAGILTGTLRVTMDAGYTPPADEASFNLMVKAPGGSAVTITINNPICMQPRARRMSVGRQMREYTYTLLGKVNTGVLDPIIAIA